ncbi:MAG: gamma-glutamyltransferase [Polyangiaceae bacterium]
MGRVESFALVALLGCGSTHPLGTAPITRSTSSADPSTPMGSASAAPAPPVKRASDRGAVSTENQAVADLALRVLADGGTAADAAIAAVLLAGVVQPASTGLGGDGFAIVWDAEAKKASALDFRARAPGGIKASDHVGRETSTRKRGVMVGVPGLVAGLGALSKLASKKSWGELVTLVADTAEKGFTVTPYAAQSFAWLAEDPGDAKLLARWGFDASAKDHTGETARNDALVATLRELASGPGTFYQGAFAKDVVDTVIQGGGVIGSGDLIGYTAIPREPMNVRWGDVDVLMPPAPCAGSFIVAEMLGLFPPEDVKRFERGSGDYVHFLAEGLRASGEDKLLAIGDPDFTKTDADAFLAPDRLAKKRAAFTKDATTLPKRVGLGHGGTFSVVVVDANQNAVSITSTLGDVFGARLMTAGGYPLNDALVDFTMDEYGQRPTNRGPNFPRGGARPASAMTPAIVLADGALEVALGASGGYRIPSAIAETLFAHLAFGARIQDAVAAPRFHTTPTGTLLLDPALQSLKEDLLARAEIVEDRKGDFAPVSAVSLRHEEGLLVLEAAADPRKSGVGVVAPGAP